MSSRALRKLHGRQELEGLTVDDEIDEEECHEKTQTAVVNPFALLGDDEEDDEIEETNDIENVVPKDIPQQGAKKKKKKKKKKNKEKVAEKFENGENMDEIDASLQEVERILGESKSTHIQDTEQSTVTSSMKALLTVEHKNLNPDNEMKRIFGSRVVQAEMSRRQPRNARARKKATWMSTPKDTWPPIGKIGLSMTLKETRNGVQYYIFEHSKDYQKIQFQFYEAVESLNPQNIANILQIQGYHIDALIALSDVFKMSEDMQMSAELLERALHSFETSFHPLFSLTTGNCRLQFKIAENRPFYLTVFKHLTYVGQRGCYRTALEFCKLLLSLDPDNDPMCVLLMIDFYALRSEEFAFLIRLFNEWEGHRNLSQLPNFAFSLPLAMFCQADKNGEDTIPADNLLQKSLMMFPGFLMPLLDNCSVNPDSEVSSHSFFSPTAQYSQSDALKQLISLYVGRCHSCWKPPEVLQWLERNVKVVLQRVNDKDPLMEEYNKKRKTRYQGTPRNILRHILLSEIKDATAALPQDLANTTVVSYDPLPPTDSIAAYESPQRTRRINQESSTLTNFFRSLMPNFNLDEPAAPVQPAQGAEGGAQNLRQGMVVLMGAMRDLLNNIRPVEHPFENPQNEGDNQNNDEEGDEAQDDEWD
ncbi:ribosome quality control complex subunit TCF25-like [Mytilus trossulus]|uniref:ribosome quality control complex subunit TCF25-like n=1 Tax=Mytilus trossulus TaxID=6551 RepID=UPI0030075AA9